MPQTLGAENRKLVAGSPLLIGVMLDRAEYRPGELSSFYSLFSMGAAMENLWLTTVELGMGIQFVSFPMEVPGEWDRIVALLKVPDELELMAVYRLGYLPEERRRPAIDWTSSERKLPSQYVFRERADAPAAGLGRARAAPRALSLRSVPEAPHRREVRRSRVRITTLNLRGLLRLDRAIAADHRLPARPSTRT